MAVTNNMGLPNILYDGRYLKSINHLYNKKIAKINSECFSSSNRYSAITRKRNNQINDYISKVSKDLVNWCVENRIDTVVVGLNKHWKDNSKMDNVNNQNFIQIPHTRLIFNLKYRLEQRGINLIETEEAYSSKASYLEKDPLPQYDPNLKMKFSGRRVKRGLYKSKEGVILNADLNGSANIMRKVFPNEIVSFDKVQIIKNVTSIRGQELHELAITPQGVRSSHFYKWRVVHSDDPAIYKAVVHYTFAGKEETRTLQKLSETNDIKLPADKDTYIWIELINKETEETVKTSKSIVKQETLQYGYWEYKNSINTLKIANFNPEHEYEYQLFFTSKGKKDESFWNYKPYNINKAPFLTDDGNKLEKETDIYALIRNKTTGEVFGTNTAKYK